jgi:hypothetical protein
MEAGIVRRVSIFGINVTPPPDASPAAWLPALLGEFGTLGGLVPDGYEAYVRVHPSREDGPHAPDDIETVAALASLLAEHTTTPDLIWFAVWEGYGWASASALLSTPALAPFSWLTRAHRRRRGRSAERQRADEVRQGLAAVPRFELPHRRYHLLWGPLASASRIDSPDGFGAQAPDLWWPEDRRWFVATDTDLDWTCVGGSDALVGDITVALPGRTEPVEWSAPNSG